MAFSLFGANSFQEACHKGANARVLFRVLNDLQNPVAGAKVNVFFDMADRVEGRYVVGITDTNGVCVIEGKTVGVFAIVRSSLSVGIRQNESDNEFVGANIF